MRSVKLAAVAAVALALGGCATGNPQVAAYVDSYQVSQAQVDTVAGALADLSSDTTDNAGAWRPTVVQLMIQNRATELAIESKAVSVTDQQRQDLLTQQPELSELAKNPAIAGFIADYVDTVIVRSTDAGSAAANESLAAAHVRVNPRFGTWDPRQGALVEGSTGSISEVAPLKQG